MLQQLVKAPLRNFLRARGYDVVRGPNLHGFLASRSVDLVVDVGGNDGGYGWFLRKWGYHGKILSFEPTSRAFSRLETKIYSDPAWKAVKVAVGAEPGSGSIKVSDDDRFSSFNALTDEGRAYDPHAAVAVEETVEIVTLDDYLRPIETKRPFLKIDTQGFERQVLDGAEDFLKRCVGVQLELPIQHLYEGVWSLQEALSYMETRGFMLAQVTPTNPRHDDYESVAELDCVFRPIGAPA